MHALEDPHYLQLYLIANTLGIVLLALAWLRPAWARWGFVLLFTWAAWTNLDTAVRKPAVYLEYADLTFLPVYRTIILGPFAAHAALYVSLVACCQAAIAIGLLIGAPLARTAAWGAVVFLVAIAPFGVGSGFPATLMYAVGLVLLLKRGLDGPAWRRPLNVARSAR